MVAASLERAMRLEYGDAGMLGPAGAIYARQAVAARLEMRNCPASLTTRSATRECR